MRRAGKELVAFRKMLKAERKKGVRVEELAEKHGVSTAYIYQLGAWLREKVLTFDRMASPQNFDLKEWNVLVRVMSGILAFALVTSPSVSHAKPKKHHQGGYEQKGKVNSMMAGASLSRNSRSTAVLKKSGNAATE
jgi:hypothetical protein